MGRFLPRRPTGVGVEVAAGARFMATRTDMSSGLGAMSGF